jgi:glycosyltransferase involved in cell wall biosynthesis
MALTDRSGRIEYRLATLDGEGAWARWVREQGVTPIVLGRRAGGGHGRFGVRAVVRCVRQVRAQRVDVVYVIGLRASLWLRLLKPWLGRAKIAQGVRWNPASRSWLDVAFTGIERWLGPAIDVYICNSRIAADTIAARCRIPRGRIHVVHNGVPAVPDGLPRYADRPPLVLTVANLAPRKGFLEYLEVVQSVVAADGAVRFVFVGRDDMDGAVQAAIRHRGLADRVTCVGYQDVVSPWMRQARLFVLPSLWNEGCPTAILEAKAHAVPVVAYAVDAAETACWSSPDTRPR